MNLPGFTAEASLPQKDLQYRAEGAPTTSMGNPEVIPQICFQMGTLVSLSTGAVSHYWCCRNGMMGQSACFWDN